MSDPIVDYLRKGRADLAALRDSVNRLQKLMREADAAGAFDEDGDEEEEVGWHAWGQREDGAQWVQLTQEPQESAQEAADAGEASTFFDGQSWEHGIHKPKRRIVVCRVNEDPEEDGISIEELAADDAEAMPRRRSHGGRTVYKSAPPERLPRKADGKVDGHATSKIWLDYEIEELGHLCREMLGVPISQVCFCTETECHCHPI